MPTYEYKCRGCDHEFERILSIKEYDDKREQTCSECGSEDTFRIFTSCNFVLKGDSWPGKAMKVNNQMMKRREKATVRQTARLRDEHQPSLVPNVDGERVNSWSEAKKLAESKGYNTSSYDPMIRKEKADI